MEYVTFKKIHDDEFCVIYSYSRDSDLHDGRIEIKKGDPDFADFHVWFEKNVELTPSQTDTDEKLFGFKAIDFLLKCLKSEHPLPGEHRVAYQGGVTEHEQ
ncbi:MAG: hypothetical protein FWG66_08430 [Spirochaetes bacterium]|nr:hypothetical protein [Spirochaetota bacterium]